MALAEILNGGIDRLAEVVVGERQSTAISAVEVAIASLRPANYDPAAEKQAPLLFERRPLSDFGQTATAAESDLDIHNLRSDNDEPGFIASLSEPAPEQLPVVDTVEPTAENQPANVVSLADRATRAAVPAGQVEIDEDGIRTGDEIDSPAPKVAKIADIDAEGGLTYEALGRAA